MISTLNPNATIFVSKTPVILRPSLKPSKTPVIVRKPLHQSKTRKILNQLDALSTSVAEKLFQPLSHLEFEMNLVHKELLAQRALEEQIKLIPKITNVDGLQQVAQISFEYECFELFWDGQYAFLDSPTRSWQIPDMSIRDIISCIFDNVIISNDSPALDEPASTSPAIQLTLTPVYDEYEWED